MRGHPVIDDPFVDRTEQIGFGRRHAGWLGHGSQARIVRSTADRLWRNAGREKMASA
jgi:hypothetical protein